MTIPAFAFKVRDPGPITDPVGLASWLGRFLAKTQRPAPPAPRPSAAREGVVERHVRASPPAQRKEDPETPIEDRLRVRLNRAIRDLDAQTTGAERTPPFLTLLGHLAADQENRLRRPPAAAERAMAACRREEVSVPALVTLLERDPSLTQAILARANGAYYSRGGPPCLSLGDAVVRQGRQSVHTVLLEQTLNNLIYAGSDHLRHMIGKVWSHMVRTAPLARDLAPIFDVDPEQAFALGLLHDVGKLAIFDRMATLRTAQRAEFILPAPTLARTLRLVHEPLGGLCALGWQLGDAAALAIAGHHREPLPASRHPFTEVIWLAERVDIAAANNRPVDAAELWLTGGLSGDPAQAEPILREHEVPTVAVTA